MESAPARLSDIAAQAGVSEATVSRVFNGKSGVPTAARQALVAAVDPLGYERPPRLRQRSAGLIGCTPLLCTQTPADSTADSTADTERVSAPFMPTDDRTAVRLAVSHLVEPGRERIGPAVGPRWFVQPVEAMGQAAVHALPEEIGGTPAPHAEFVFMPELVVRGSTGAGPR
ncbi:LacI family DNA-binding transcriptional regulator [Saccharothrix syringae]|uniref:LacI family DNA-binding transcriptional regulator n=1 Tax=Saccharothrix syringae TaxID=103733 RepID=A0A5Q0H2P5_SACSY|nr:LacI family DNA-binding transcriptional regulator [Saccharothrix syringae]QFZ20090.1 LacI family DNA-binding transcriptional regulator [Saccharothrix syringae]